MKNLRPSTTTTANLLWLNIVLAFISHGAESRPLKNVKESARRVWGLVGYIQSDYSAAVKNRVIIDHEEFKELRHFASLAEEMIQEELVIPHTGKTSPNHTANERALLLNIKRLQNAIQKKLKRQEIIEITSSLQKQLINTFEIAHKPRKKPDLQLAKKIYNSVCSSCHGDSGKGDGPAASQLKPQPPNFSDPEMLRLASPFRFYNVIKDGIAGTAMASYGKQFEDHEIWSLSFFLFQHARAPQDAGTPEQVLKNREKSEISSLNITYQDLANMTNGELEKKISRLNVASSSADDDRQTSILQKILFVRSLSGLTDPEKAQGGEVEHESQHALEYAISKVEEALRALQLGDRSTAKGRLIDSYLEGFELVEAPLSIVAPKLTRATEKAYLLAREKVQSGSTQDAINGNRKLLAQLKVAQEKLTEQKLSVGSEFFSGLTIIVREGLEAFLIVSALLALISTSGAIGARRWVHSGWIAALVLGFITFLGIKYTLAVSGANRENIELLFSLIAALMMAYTGLWLLNKNVGGAALRDLKAKTHLAITAKRKWALFSIVFVAVYREASETALFISALLQNSGSPINVLTGVSAGIFLLCLTCWFIKYLQVKLPLPTFFRATSLLMLSLAVILVGKVIHTAISIGLIQPIPLHQDIFNLETLGIYPEMHSLIGQLLAISTLILVHQIAKTLQSQKQ